MQNTWIPFSFSYLKNSQARAKLGYSYTLTYNLTEAVV